MGCGSPTLASNTASQGASFAMRRNMTVAKTEQNRIGKVGVLTSSQRTGLQVSSFANRRTQFQKENRNDVKSALAKVRSGGCVPPKKVSTKNWNELERISGIYHGAYFIQHRPTATHLFLWRSKSSRSYETSILRPNRSHWRGPARTRPRPR